MKHFYLYTNEIFNSELLICVGLNTDQIVKRLPKYLTKDAVKVFQDRVNIECIRSQIEEKYVNGFLVSFIKDGIAFYFLWFREFKDNWESFDLLNHEIVHYRQMQFEERGIKNEIEFEAYFQQSVCRSLRKLLP